RERLVHRQLEDSRHRRHFPPDAFPLADEQRIDQAVGRQPRLAHERADRLGAPQPPRAARQVESGERLDGHWLVGGWWSVAGGGRWLVVVVGARELAVQG